MHICDWHSNMKGVGIRGVYAIATARRNEDENHPIRAQDFINEQANDLDCLQVSSIFGNPGSTYNYERNGFLSRTAPIDGPT